MRTMRKYIYVFIALLLINTSCSEYLNINNDPNLPTQAELHKLLTGAQVEVGTNFSAGSYIGSVLPSYVFHLTSREVDNYGIIPSYASLGNTWQKSYSYSLKNLDAVIDAASSTDNMIYAGIGKLLKAYVFVSVVDLWGDVPYSECNNPSINNPKVDSSVEIYNTLLELIDDGLIDLNNKSSANLLKPGADDLIYNGNVEKWIAMGNTLKLKMLVQSRKAKSEIKDWQSRLTALLQEDKFIKTNNDFEFKHYKQDNPDERHPAYAREYLAGQSTHYISPWLFEMMSGKNLNVKDNPFVGITDPRIPYYWYNQLTTRQDAQNATDYRDGPFVSIFFASNSAYKSNDQRETSTFIGIYPCGGKYDKGDDEAKDGKKPKADKNVGNGVAPNKMLQAYSVPFLKAELYLVGEAVGDAKAALVEGINRSITHVNAVAKNSDSNTPMISKEKLQEFTDHIIAKYEVADTEGKLKIVMIQKWIANFFNSVEAYADLRRTGYPKVVDSSFDFAQSPYKSDKKATLGPVEIPLGGLNAFQRALYYPSIEVTRNKNVINEGRNIASPILFWDKP